jgi:sugar phosphate isomerase/epimerase
MERSRSKSVLVYGEGTIQFAPVVQAIKDIGWSGWGNLGTDARPVSLDADMRCNLTYMLQIVHKAYAWSS